VSWKFILAASQNEVKVNTLLPEVLCLAPSPAVDRTSIIPGYTLGQIQRPQQVVALAGGKGVNVARAVTRLGGRAHAGLIVAGHNGAWVMAALQAEGIPAFAAWTDGETRICHSVIDPQARQVTEIYEHGIPTSREAWQAFVDLAEQHFSLAQFVALSGNLPPGVPLDGMAQLIARARRAGVHALVDSYSASLRLALAEKPFLVKVNAAEAGELVGETLNSIEAAARAGESMRVLGAGLAVITLGKDGAVGVSSQGAWQVCQPPIEALAAVGSGDSFLAGLAVSLQSGASLPEALRLASGTGAANTLQPGAGVFDPAIARDLAARSQLERIALA
jgi:1-phosphofructokinase family hexose kinase